MFSVYFFYRRLCNQATSATEAINTIDAHKLTTDRFPVSAMINIY